MPKAHDRLRKISPRDWRRWLTGLGVLIVVWAGVGLTVGVAKAKKPTSGKVAVEAQKAAEIPGDRGWRAPQLERLAERIQQLSLDDRLDPQLIEAIEASFASMTPAEQRAFVRDIMPPGLEPMIQAFREMDDTQKRLAIDRLRREFKHAGWIAEDTDRSTFSAWVESSVSAFSETEDPEAQLDLLPVMQQVLRAMQTR
ncbi:hypothetical protein [Algisphaera agarilytica]|uniref:Uncharacterized protein n=1 Tax=Algisphaera agarilytica TaxID=1385975 RepID=A0A7X0LK31_9BACT|nr:hypothetical protein [Algisphaera agarilytica]MBB6428538.1 hypothetical protein [Algisphaera agarilytica]